MEEFIKKWSCWWVLQDRKEEITIAFRRELEELISSKGEKLACENCTHFDKHEKICSETCVNWSPYNKVN